MRLHLSAPSFRETGSDEVTRDSSPRGPMPDSMGKLNFTFRPANGQGMYG
jgi:hypothetical protein